LAYVNGCRMSIYLGDISYFHSCETLLMKFKTVCQFGSYIPA
jgi:hypothetical protein